MNNQEYKRQYRELDDATKQKIGDAVRGRSKSQSHRDKISRSMTEYWKTVPNRPADDENGHTTMDELIGTNQSNDHLSK